jgi:GT2 family glycosyltransferase
LAFCDADDEVGAGWVAAIGEALSKHDFVACSIEIAKLNRSWVQQTHGNGQSSGLHKIWYPPYLSHAGGGTLGVKKSLHQAIGGFDESLPYLHDTDYCFRIQLAGTKLHFVPNATVHVRYRDKLSGIFHQARLWAEYNVLLSKRYQSYSADYTAWPLWKRRLIVFIPWIMYLKEWKRLLLRLPQLRDRGGRAAWVWLLGWQLGRLNGSIRHRAYPV